MWVRNIMLGLGKIAKKVFGTPNDRRIREVQAIVENINSLEKDFSLLSDSEITSKTKEFKQRYGEGETLDKLLPEAFANCREAAKRALGLRAFDVQLVGGIFLHRGNISEMKTGEGKTLVATFPAYLNALVGKGVHIVTVNDYLAKRDAEWMSKVYTALGMTTGVVYPQQEDPNWGRIVMAIGKSGASADRDKLSIRLGEILVAEDGWVSPTYKEADGAKYMKRQRLNLNVDLGLGKGEATVWTCDLTQTYIQINADYRS